MGRTDLAEYLFGPIPESFFSLLGQTIGAAGLVELKVYELVTSLERVTQDAHAGRPLRQMIKSCHRILADGFVPEFGGKVKAALADVETSMKRRNAVVHSVWTLTRDGRIFGWRPAPDGERDVPPPSPGAAADTKIAAYGLASRSWTEHDLEDLFGSLTALVPRLTNLRDESDVSRLPG
jgi:hypothetical protein